MKVFAYGIRDDEVPALKSWQEENPTVEVDYTNEVLTADTVALAKGANSVVTLQLDPYGADVLEGLADLGIKNLSLRNVGTETIDFEAAKRLGFNLSNVPVYSPNAIAEHAMIQLSRLLRRTKPMDAKVAKHDLRWAPTIGREVRMQTVGVIGTGNIGRKAINILKGFGAKVIAYDKYPNKELQEEGLYVDTLDELFAQADAISLHVPGVPENVHLVNEESLAKMKDGVVIVNTSRGNLIDTDAAIAALDSGKISDLALDVYEEEVGIFDHDWSHEKLPDDKLADLITRDNVLITPHVAFYTTKAIHEMVYQSMSAAVAFANGETPDNALKY
ncbi:D-2-hydroxyacid dehydrogenase [Fructobacillus evanidus]|uniref:Lactate dehydrogenase or related 2-hydroxyacid dehydrogenase (LdhA) n=1 Tax=Fructobacillus evanidus TaxID=3064281 RepID=A0ABM9MV45_9LACO|nr:Lactate dehydrogenase or related 2-hydroxyacid dehydrogenase (LdhA) [Fructobacillus sp. LMG 32999]CAK1236602.1 Lactate dehydrogenase or related 2-hydroxyacid dehydrogenase (LdhA) [Fructobacillus sp. LMG 32999]CAK1242305.1 Lactate dehydrogenase or related 2-hydroxyacid dehydrogenase (LdhA) [Fructobacillus sp. LMG 32999]CAK1244097.1 Lactate dehydrogenase or related 2-hydroxyacid dehydrogenase (LdhA) [Fructobacillus sp. LMG 32999]CAK1246850.1 Lactate dehydrogenase or related 2-hydroxyacid dehyd